MQLMSQEIKKEMKKKSKRKTLIIMLLILMAIILQTLPVFFPKPLGSLVLADENITLYYQLEGEKGAYEVFNLLKEKASEIKLQMNVEQNQPVTVYLYQSQFQLAIREAGLITMTFAPSWHIGDSHNGTLMMVSPYTKVKGHTHDSILNATLHELVHSIVFTVNPDLPYFIDNGLATYLSAQKPSESEFKPLKVPSLADMHTENGLTFANMGGYAYSYKYIEFLESAYGWERIIEFTKGTKSYLEVFGKTEEALYDEWCLYLLN